MLPGSAPGRHQGSPGERRLDLPHRHALHPKRTSPSSTSGWRAKLGLETVGFLMMSHTIPPEKLAVQARIMADAGCQCVYVVDSAGALVLEGVARPRGRACR